jgi:hypothetical protein
MIRFNCPYCRKTLQVGEKHAGKQARCLNCGKPIRIPEPPSLNDLDIDTILDMVGGDSMTKIRRATGS